MRKEQDYKNDIADQQAIIDDLNKKIELAKKDNTMSGQKRLEDLMEQLNKENEKLQDMTQDRIDDVINNMYDSEIDRIEEENDKTIADLEEKWSDEKIAEMVAQALGSGQFESITGEIVSLQDALLDYAKECGDTFGVMGEMIESELVANLQLALDTMKEIDDINSKLGFTTDYTVQGNTPPKTDSTTETINKAITLYSNPTFQIQGETIDAEEIQEMIDESNQKLIDEFLKY